MQLDETIKQALIARLARVHGTDGQGISRVRHLCSVSVLATHTTLKIQFRTHEIGRKEVKLADNKAANNKVKGLGLGVGGRAIKLGALTYTICKLV